MTLKRSKILVWTMVQIPRSGLGLLLLVAVCLALGSVTAAGADTPATVPAQNGVSSLEVDVHKDVAKVESRAAEEEHGLTQAAVPVLNKFGRLPITNSMLVTWFVALGLIIFAQVATRDMKRVPAGSQNFWEWLVESLYNFIEGIVGRHLVKRMFWFLATIFIFILATNWFGLIPGVGTIGWGYQTDHGFVIDQPLLRGANADLNLTAAMALIFFGCWIVWTIQEVGVGGALKETFGAKGNTTGFMKILMVVIFFAAGCLEIVSILFRPIALSFRLYGNIFAGENTLDAMSKLVPSLGWLLPIPFYFLELLVGLVQALVFMLLCAVFTLLICQHEEKGTPAAQPKTG